MMTEVGITATIPIVIFTIATQRRLVRGLSHVAVK